MKKLFRLIYTFIPLKRELYSLLKKVWQPPERVFQHLHFVGVIPVKIDNHKKFRIKHYGFQLENEIFWKGLTNGWEKESIKLWIKLCQSADVVIDVGANTGVYSLIAKTVNPQAQVYAFEPVRRVFDKLKTNISLNNFDILPVEKAISNTDGSAIIYDTGEEHIYSVTVNKNMSSPKTSVHETKIETLRLDTFIQQVDLKKIDLIKIDVETHEPEVLEGFMDHLVRFKPAMLIEILSDEVGQKVNALVEKAGYCYFNIDEQGGVRQVERITKSDYYNYLLCSAEIAKEAGLL